MSATAALERSFLLVPRGKLTASLGVMHLARCLSVACVCRAVGTATDIRQIHSRGLIAPIRTIYEGSVGSDVVARIPE